MHSITITLGITIDSCNVIRNKLTDHCRFSSIVAFLIYLSLPLSPSHDVCVHSILAYTDKFNEKIEWVTLNLITLSLFFPIFYVRIKNECIQKLFFIYFLCRYSITMYAHCCITHKIRRASQGLVCCHHMSLGAHEMIHGHASVILVIRHRERETERERKRDNDAIDIE